MIFHTRIPFLFWVFAIVFFSIVVVMIQNGAVIPTAFIWILGVNFIIIGLAFSSERK